jgi:serine/threonine protein kinase
LLGAKEYSLEVDSWSIGCIFYELVTGSIFLSGDSEIDQLFKLFKLLGPPNESIWPGVTSYEFWKEKFPKFNAIDFEKHC